MWVGFICPNSCSAGQLVQAYNLYMLTIYGLGEVLRLQAHFDGVKWMADQCHTDTTCEAVLGSALYNLV